METTTKNRKSEELDSFTIFLHFGLIFFGVLVWLTGDWAGDYKKVKYLGFTVHKMLGMGTALFVGGRLFHGFWGPEQARFANWLPYTSERVKMVFEDIHTLFTLKLPERAPHQGLAALWESLGLAICICAWVWSAGPWVRGGGPHGGAAVAVGLERDGCRVPRVGCPEKGRRKWRSCCAWYPV